MQWPFATPQRTTVFQTGQDVHDRALETLEKQQILVRIIFDKAGKHTCNTLCQQFQQVMDRRKGGSGAERAARC